MASNSHWFETLYGYILYMLCMCVLLARLGLKRNVKEKMFVYCWILCGKGNGVIFQVTQSTHDWNVKYNARYHAIKKKQPNAIWSTLGFASSELKNNSYRFIWKSVVYQSVLYFSTIQFAFCHRFLPIQSKWPLSNHFNLTSFDWP